MKKMFVFIMMAMLIVIMTGCSKNEVAENNDISWNGKENVITEHIIEENILVENIEVEEIEVVPISVKPIEIRTIN